METAYMRPRISTNLHVEMYFDFIASSYARNGFLANVMLLDALKKQFQEKPRKVLAVIFHCPFYALKKICSKTVQCSATYCECRIAKYPASAMLCKAV